MIRNNIAYYQYLRGINSNKELARRAESTPRAIRKLKRHETSSIDFDLMSRLCVLFKCQPGDLFVEDPLFVPPHLQTPEAA